MTINPKKLKEKIQLYTLAKAMSVPPTTVYSWEKANKIPSWRIDSVLVACKKLNIDISDCYKA